jgi:hypothetical protein
MDPNVERIHETAKRWTGAITDTDIATLRELMTEDIVVIHGNGHPVQGRQAVEADLVRRLGDSNNAASLKRRSSPVSGHSTDRVCRRSSLQGQALNRNSGTREL